MLPVRHFVNPLTKVEVFRSCSEVQVIFNFKVETASSEVISFNFSSSLFHLFFVFLTQVLDILLQKISTLKIRICPRTSVCVEAN